MRISLHKPLTGVDFLLPGNQLFTGFGQIGLPIEAFVGIYLVSGGQMVKRVHAPRDLIEKVRIDDPAKALRFVRLFTSPNTEFMMGRSRWIEVVPASAYDDRLSFKLFGDEYLGGLQESHSNTEESPRERGEHRFFGIVYDDEWQDNAFNSPEVEKITGGFIVRRTLYQPFEGNRHGTRIAYWIAETVWSNGRVRKKRRSRIDVKGGIILTSPSYR